MKIHSVYQVESLLADWNHARDMVRACGTNRELARIWRRESQKRRMRFIRARDARRNAA